MVKRTGSNAVTYLFDTLVEEVITKEQIADAAIRVASGVVAQSEYRFFDVLWDTGATMSAISREVVQRCSLAKYGERRVDTSSDRNIDVSTYLVSFLIGDDIVTDPLEVLLLDIPGANALFGMDVIARGDFAISQKDSNTLVSFRSPGIETIDFTL